MASASLLLGGTERDSLAAFFEPRASEVDACRAGVREGIAFVHARVLASDDEPPNADLERVARTVATVAWSDLATAFSLWCHRMVLEYDSRADADSRPRALLPRLAAVELLGSTGLAAAMAHHVAGAPLPLTARRFDGGFEVSGAVRWASNLFWPDFVLVTAAADADGGSPIVFAVPGDAPGLRVDPYPALLALGATASSSLTFSEVRVGPEWVVSTRLGEFLPAVRPTFLILQSGFCWGLARRALDEAARALRGPSVVLAPDLEALEATAAELARILVRAAHTRGESVPLRELVRVRLEAARLATASVALEAKALGSRAYLAEGPTARRLREAAFLPIQAPTEGQLRWELAQQASGQVQVPA